VIGAKERVQKGPNLHPSLTGRGQAAEVLLGLGFIGGAARGRSEAGAWHTL
jgi:hypothetical protein